MLEFFRKYQRVFFIFVTVIIIVSFSFFGTYSALAPSDEKKEIIIGKAIDGSKLKYLEIKHLASLLAAEPGHASLIEKDLLKTGVAERLATAYCEQLRGEWRSRLERAKRYRFYTHPSAPAINAREIFSHVTPSLMEEVERLQTLADVPADFFAQWSRLFFLREQCPPDFLKRILLYSQDQIGVPRDPYLYDTDFSLFGLRTLQDWFGRDFFELIAQFILNGAAAASQRGYQVGRAEVDADLLQRFHTKEVSADLLLRSLGIRKDEALRLWQKAMLFLRYFQEAGQVILLDDLPYRQFAEFAGDTAVLDVYHLPKELQFKSLDEFLAFEIYTQLACEPSPDILSPPVAQLCAEEVEKRAPQLISTIYSIRCAEIDERKIASRLSMKQVWDWQMEEMNWNALCAAFPELYHAQDQLCQATASQNMSSLTESSINDSSKGDRFQMIEQLGPLRRSVIDEWSRSQIVKEHSEWIEQEFMDVPVQDLEIALIQDQVDGFSIQDGAAFRTSLNAALSGDLEPLKTHQEKGQQTIRRITDVRLVAPKSVVSFAEAKAKGLIDIDAFLEQAYQRLRGAMPSLFLADGGDWKPLSDVKNLVIQQAFIDLFRAIDANGSKQLLEYYITHRFEAWMNRMLTLKKSGLSEAANVSQGLWNIEKTERTITRTSSEEWIMKQPFILQTDLWSQVYVPPTGEVVFFFLKERNVKTGPILDQIQLGREILVSDVQRHLTDKLLGAAMEKQAIVCPISIEGEKNDDL